MNDQLCFFTATQSSEEACCHMGLATIAPCFGPVKRPSPPSLASHMACAAGVTSSVSNTRKSTCCLGSRYHTTHAGTMHARLGIPCSDDCKWRLAGSSCRLVRNRRIPSHCSLMLLKRGDTQAALQMNLSADRIVLSVADPRASGACSLPCSLPGTAGLSVLFAVSVMTLQQRTTALNSFIDSLNSFLNNFSSAVVSTGQKHTMATCQTGGTEVSLHGGEHLHLRDQACAVADGRPVGSIASRKPWEQ